MTVYKPRAASFGGNTYLADTTLTSPVSGVGFISYWYNIGTVTVAKSGYGNWSSAFQILEAWTAGSFSTAPQALAVDITHGITPDSTFTNIGQQKLYVSFNNCTDQFTHPGDNGFGMRSPPLPMDAMWHNIQVAWDLSTTPYPQFVAYLDNVLLVWEKVDGQIGYLANYHGPFTVQYNTNFEWYIGGHPPYVGQSYPKPQVTTDGLIGGLAELYLNVSTANHPITAIADPTFRAKFITVDGFAGTLGGMNGSFPFGDRPLIYLSGNATMLALDTTIPSFAVNTPQAQTISAKALGTLNPFTVKGVTTGLKTFATDPFNHHDIVLT